MSNCNTSVIPSFSWYVWQQESPKHPPRFCINFQNRAYKHKEHIAFFQLLSWAKEFTQKFGHDKCRLELKPEQISMVLVPNFLEKRTNLLKANITASATTTTTTTTQTNLSAQGDLKDVKEASAVGNSSAEVKLAHEKQEETSKILPFLCNEGVLVIPTKHHFESLRLVEREELAESEAIKIFKALYEKSGNRDYPIDILIRDISASYLSPTHDKLGSANNLDSTLNVLGCDFLFAQVDDKYIGCVLFGSDREHLYFDTFIDPSYDQDDALEKCFVWKAVISSLFKRKRITKPVTVNAEGQMISSSSSRSWRVLKSLEHLSDKGEAIIIEEENNDRTRQIMLDFKNKFPSIRTADSKSINFMFCSKIESFEKTDNVNIYF